LVDVILSIAEIGYQMLIAPPPREPMLAANSISTFMAFSAPGNMGSSYCATGEKHRSIPDSQPPRSILHGS
jgi:hypothetical protein